MGQLTIVSRIEKRAAAAARSALTKREQLLVLEIGGDAIDSASAFVCYISEAYGFSKSSVWYNLNRLKEKQVVDFATKEEPGKALELTKAGARELHALVRSGTRLEDFEMQFREQEQGQNPMQHLGDRIPNPSTVPNPPILIPAFNRLAV